MFQMYIIRFIPGNSWFYLFEVASVLLLRAAVSSVRHLKSSLREAMHKFQIIGLAGRGVGREWHDE